MRTITNNHKTMLSLRAISFACAAVTLFISSTLVTASAFADVTGTWNFSVDLGASGQGNPVFALKQTGPKLTGTYEGPLGKHSITGRVTGNNIVIRLQVTKDDGPLTLTYTGKVDSANGMSGSVNVMRGTQAGATGTWRATKK